MNVISRLFVDEIIEMKTKFYLPPMVLSWQLLNSSFTKRITRLLLPTAVSPNSTSLYVNVLSGSILLYVTSTKEVSSTYARNKYE